MQLVIHAPFGSRINRAWGLALRKRFCRSFNFELQAAATDNGINISLTEQHAFPLELVFEFLKPQTVEHVLTQALLDAPMFTARWRWNASRALAIPRFRGGRKVPPPIQRMRSDDLLASVFPDQVACAENLTGEIRIPDHPLVNETIDNCLHEAMDLEGLKRILEGLESGASARVAIDNAEPSPFSHEILNANPYAYLDDAPLEERRARAVQLRRTLRTDFAGGAGILDPAAIATVAAESWPDVRDADELHDALLSLDPAASRLRMASRSSRNWLPPAAPTSSNAAESILDRDRAPASEQTTRWPPCAAGWNRSVRSPPLPSRETLGFPLDEIESALLKLESEGQVMRGRYSSPACRRRNRMVQSAHSGAHSSAHAGPASPRNRAGDRRAISALPDPLAASGAGQPICTASMARCKSSSNCRATKSRPRPGSRKSCRGALPATNPSSWINCASPAK